MIAITLAPTLHTRTLERQPLSPLGLVQTGSCSASRTVLEPRIIALSMALDAILSLVADLPHNHSCPRLVLIGRCAGEAPSKVPVSIEGQSCCILQYFGQLGAIVVQGCRQGFAFPCIPEPVGKVGLEGGDSRFEFFFRPSGARPFFGGSGVSLPHGRRGERRPRFSILQVRTGWRVLVSGLGDTSVRFRSASGDTSVRFGSAKPDTSTRVPARPA